MQALSHQVASSPIRGGLSLTWTHYLKGNGFSTLELKKTINECLSCEHVRASMLDPGIL